MNKAKILSFVLLIAFAYANPYIETLISEFQTAPDSLERIELHALPFPYTIDLGGWTITTNAGTATINPGTILPYNGYVTIDRTNTSGVFSLNDISDTIKLCDNRGYGVDEVSWPSLPAMWGCSPTPPYGGSGALYRSNTYWMEINWYIDSTPTFDAPNDDYSSISGRILNQNGQPVVGAEVRAYGPTGGCDGYSDSLGDYRVAGLGEGKYWVFANYRNYSAHYSDSVYVGYSQHITGINITLPLSGIAEPDKLITNNISFSFPNPVKDGSKISFNLPKTARVIMKVYDAQGVLIKTIGQKRLNKGNHQIEFNLNQFPGIYFLIADIDGQRAITEKLVYLKP
uniref:T9SS type A sorting domain-containing protein n=1 Tax=candidate division WOR-3 bacterium TaxID=2052148 RepID=A0A7C6EEW5_UNCW3